MNERLKELRKSLSMTQAEFAEELGLSKGAIESYEYGRRKLTDRTIGDICRKFKVSEKWLRDGEGEMRSDQDESLNTIEKLSEILSAESPDEDVQFQQQLLAALVSLDESELRAIRKFVQRLAKKEEDH